MKKLWNDFKEFFKNDEFQEDLIFLIYVTILLKLNIIPNETFEMLATVIITGDVIKKLGKRK
jgi:hypothetical protein